MMRKALSVISILLIIAVALCAYGEKVSWDCPNCGRTGNMGNYCGSCAHPAPWLNIENPESVSITPTSTPDPNGSFDYEAEFDGKIRKGTYSGENENGIPNGTGTFVSSDDLPALVYEGNWANGKPQGKGHLRSDGCTIHFDTKGQGVFDRTGFFEGEVISGIPNGKGSFSAVNSDGVKWVYTGAFAEGTFSGRGEQVWFDKDSTTVLSILSGNFTNGEYMPSWSDYISSMAQSDGYSVFEDSLKFIKQHESVFTQKTSLVPSLVDENWKLGKFIANPDQYASKLICMKDLTVTQVIIDDIRGFDNAFLLLENNDGIMIYGYIAENFNQEVGSSISEIYLLPINWITYLSEDGRNIEAVFCAYAKTGNVVLTPKPTNTPKPTPKPTNTPKPTPKPTNTPKPTPKPTSTPKPTPKPTNTPKPTPVSYSAPKGSNRSVRIIGKDLTVTIGKKKLKLITEITALTDDAPAKSTLVWSSNNTGIAKVDAGGNVTGVKPGTATITCSLKDNPEVKAWTTVTVIQPVKSIKLSEKKLTILPDSSKKVEVTITPVDASNQNVKWKSSNDSVATVSQTGMINAHWGGDCEITCTTEDGSYSASVAVHVPSFKVSKSEVTVYNKSGTSIDVTWYCDDILTLRHWTSAYFNVSWVDGGNKIKIVPKKAGKGHIVVFNKKYPEDKVNISITIDKQAVQ